MNDEIKEIIDEFLKEKSAYSLRYSFNGDLAYSQEQILKDYITNLQEENKDLKELCDKYEEEHNTTFKLWKMKMEEMPTYEEKMNYKSGIDKAIEYITTFKNENERLNNIIDEFNEWLIGEKMMFYKSSNGEMLIRYEETKSKWLGLKESE